MLKPKAMNTRHQYNISCRIQSTHERTHIIMQFIVFVCYPDFMLFVHRIEKNQPVCTNKIKSADIRRYISSVLGGKNEEYNNIKCQLK